MAVVIIYSILVVPTVKKPYTLMAVNYPDNAVILSLQLRLTVTHFTLF